MTKLLLQKRLGALRPLDEAGEQTLRAFTEGEVVSIDMPAKPRNVRFHRLYFALLNLVWQNTEQFKTVEHLLTVVKIGIGHADMVQTQTGAEYWHPRSISFAKMDEVAFREFWDKSVDFIIANILPVGKSELENEVFALLGFDLTQLRSA